MCFHSFAPLSTGTSSVEYVRKILILGHRGGKCINFLN